jgi:hypothetical protein
VHRPVIDASRILSHTLAMGRKRATGTVIMVVGIAIVALGIVGAVTSDAELWWINVLFPGLYITLGVIVAWAGWTTRRST